MAWSDITLSSPTDNIIVNGTFDTDASSWDTNNVTISSVNGGVSGKCLQIQGIFAAGINQVRQTYSSFVVGKTYILTVAVKSGTGGVKAFSIGFTDSSHDWYGKTDGNSSSDWTYHTVTWIATVTEANIVFRKNAANDTMLFDEAELIYYRWSDI